MATAKAKGTKKKTKRERRERRFVPQATSHPGLVTTLAAFGAIALGAGVFEVFMRSSRGLGDPEAFAPYVLGVAGVLLGAAIWMGTTGDTAVLVGDAGVGVDKGGPHRMPWYAITSIKVDDGVLVVDGADDGGAAMEVRVRLASQAQAAAWIVKEARARVSAIVQVGDDVAIPRAEQDAGEIEPVPPMQVVGKRCAASDRVIGYEPDARVCPRCERVYHKESVPETCACGASLATAAAPEGGDTAEDAPVAEA